MHWTKRTPVAVAFIIVSCEMPTGEFENPLDVEAAEEKGIIPPALVFFPDSVSVPVGSSVSIQVFAMEVKNLTGARVHMTYNNANLSLSSVKAGDLFKGSTEPLFFYEDDATSGTLDIFTFYLGTDSASVSGTGNLANLIFSTTARGQSVLQYTPESELVDPDDIPIEIKGFGEGSIDAR